MEFLLLIYIIFLMIYIAVNGYILHRVWEMKIEGDKTSRAINVFTTVCAIVIILGFILLIAKY